MLSENTPDVTSGYAPVNGLKMYYEVHGSGQPLVLIHGGFGSVGMFGSLLTTLAETRQVIAVELQGYAHTADIDRPFRIESFADDIAELIRHLGFERADVMGYSLGGKTAWQTAIRHPGAVRKLVVVSAPCKRDAWFPEVLVGMGAINAEALTGSPMHASYISMAPNPGDWPNLVNKTRALLARPYDWSAEVAAIKAPVLMVAADADSFSPAHSAEIFGLLGGGKEDPGWDGSRMPKSRLAILPGSTHYNILAAPGLAAQVIAFLDAPSA